MSVDEFFNLTNHLLDDNQRNEITNLFNNVQTFNYSDVFGTNNDIPLKNPRVKSATMSMSLLRPKVINITKAMVDISDAHDKIYKVWCFHNDNYKDWFILNGLKEIYFHNLFQKYITDNNITDFIVPIIYRYGIIQNSNEFIFFIEMKKYDITPLPNFIVDENTNQIQDLIDYYSQYRDMRAIISNIEKNSGINHNDLISINRMNSTIEHLNDLKAKIENNQVDYSRDQLIHHFFDRELGNNISILADGTFILMDFEHTSVLFSRDEDKYFRDIEFYVLYQIIEHVNIV